MHKTLNTLYPILFSGQSKSDVDYNQLTAEVIIVLESLTSVYPVLEGSIDDNYSFILWNTGMIIMSLLLL